MEKHVTIWDSSRRDYVAVTAEEFLSSVVARWSNPSHCTDAAYREGFKDASDLLLCHVRGRSDVLESACQRLSAAAEHVARSLPTTAHVNAVDPRVHRLVKILEGAVGALRSAGKTDLADKFSLLARGKDE